MKKILSILLSVALLFTSIGYAKAAEMNQTGAVYSEATYGGYDLSWTNNGERDILLSATNESGTISFQYDERELRTSKTNEAGESTYFTYDDNRNLVFVQSGTHQLEYSYNVINQLNTVTIDGVTYSCELQDKSLYRLLDVDGNIAVEYHYENGFVVSVYGKNEFGELVDKTTDTEFIGNINRVTYNSYYFDEETGWYYCGRYYDANGERFVDGMSASAIELLFQRQRSSVLDEESIRERAHILYNLHINDSEFGKPIETVPNEGNWYDGMRTQEILARLIYGENPYSNTPIEEQSALAWVLWNRKMKVYLEDRMLSSIATHYEQFHAICHASEDARKPVIDSPEWRISVLYACYLICAETTNLDNPTAQLAAVMPRPYGITADHVRFCNYDSAMAKLQNGTTLRRAVIAGYGSIGSTPASLESNYLAYDEAIYEEEGYHLRTPGSTPTEDVNGYYEKVNIFYCD